MTTSSFSITPNSSLDQINDKDPSLVKIKPIEKKVHTLHSIISKLAQQQEQPQSVTNLPLIIKCERELLKSFGNSLLKQLPKNDHIRLKDLLDESDTRLFMSTDFNHLQSNLLCLCMKFVNFFKISTMSYTSLNIDFKPSYFGYFPDVVSEEKMYQFCLELANRGSFKEARVFIKNLSNKVLKDDAALYLSKHESTWRNTQAIEVIQLASSIIDPDKKDIAYLHIMYQLALKGDYEIAIMITDMIKNDFIRDNAISGISLAFVQNNKLDEAIQHLETLTDPSKKDWALYDIAILLTDQDKYTEALKIIDTIQDVLVKNQAISDISLMLVESGEIIDALKIVTNIIDPVIRIDAICKMAIKLAKNQDFKTAVEFASNDASFAAICRTLANHKRLNEAIELLDKIQYPFIKDSVICDLAIALAENGQCEKAALIASTISDDMIKDTAFSKISILFAKHGELDKAVELAEMIHEPLLQGEAYFEISKLFKTQGNYRKAIQLGNRITYKTYQHMAIFEIFDDLKKLKNLNEYIRLASTIVHPEVRDQIFQKIPQKRHGITKIFDDYLKQEKITNQLDLLICIDKFNEAIKLARTLDPKSKDKYYVKIATALVRAKNFEEAIALADKIQNEDSKEKVFNLISSNLYLMEKMKSVV